MVPATNVAALICPSLQLQNQDFIQARNGIPRCADSTTSTCGETTCRTETAAVGRGRSSRTGVDHEWCERDEVDRWARWSNDRTIVRRLQVMKVMVLTRRLADLANRYRNKTRNWWRSDISRATVPRVAQRRLVSVRH
jgi:hypothetical protein